ncbi:hypothetical protein niasHT_021359 [Heterodera trifolii]|uniref:Uncharacterized protein n=1 Tax=Heterodera trifolii TaxID=157864 RepID=A0ABD2K713_9BILA
MALAQAPKMAKPKAKAEKDKWGKPANECLCLANRSFFDSFVPPPVQRKNAVPPIPTPPNAFHFIHFNSQLKGVFVADGRTILGPNFGEFLGPNALGHYLAELKKKCVAMCPFIFLNCESSR